MSIEKLMNVATPLSLTKKADRHPSTGRFLSKEIGKGTNAKLKTPPVPANLSSLRSRSTTAPIDKDQQNNLGLDSPGKNTPPLADIMKKDFSAGKRKTLANTGAAMPDGSFPIQTGKDLENAIGLAGNAKDPEAAKAHIKSRAKDLGMEDKIPDTWTAKGEFPLGKRMPKGGYVTHKPTGKVGKVIESNKDKSLVTFDGQQVHQAIPNEDLEHFKRKADIDWSKPPTLDGKKVPQEDWDKLSQADKETWVKANGILGDDDDVPAMKDDSMETPAGLQLQKPMKYSDILRSKSPPAKIQKPEDWLGSAEEEEPPTTDQLGNTVDPALSNVNEGDKLRTIPGATR